MTKRVDKMNTLLESIGKQVKAERKKLGLSQEEFAHRVGLHRTYIGDIENGKRNISLSTLQKIILATDVSISEFFSLVEVNIRKGKKNE